jgi:hypothetical protein
MGRWSGWRGRMGRAEGTNCHLRAHFGVVTKVRYQLPYSPSLVLNPTQLSISRHSSPRYIERANATPSRRKRQHAAKPPCTQADSTIGPRYYHREPVPSFAGNMTSPTSSSDGPSSATIPTGGRGGGGRRGHPRSFRAMLRLQETRLGLLIMLLLLPLSPTLPPMPMLISREV